jgi:hypothetical protein
MTKAQDQERVEQLKLRVWGHVARNLLNGEDAPYEIPESEIESNRGRIGKALRDLSEYVRYIRTDKSQYSSGTKIYKVLRFEESKSYKGDLTFFSDLHNIHKLVIKGETPDNQIQFDTIAYKRTTEISLSNNIYIYWHLDEFDIISEGKGRSLIYPKTLLETRVKAVLRAIIEQHVYTYYHSWIETFLGIPKGSMRIDDEIKIKVRNFAAHSYRLSKENFLGDNGYLKEYTHFADYFQALAKSLKEFDQKIQDHGGYDTIVETYRKETIKLILEQAPLQAFSKKEAKREHFGYRMIENPEAHLKNPYLNAFILKNAQYFDYDILYDTDKSLMVIKDDDKQLDTTFK